VVDLVVSDLALAPGYAVINRAVSLRLEHVGEGRERSLTLALLIVFEVVQAQPEHFSGVVPASLDPRRWT
jgi:hypothetical protein